MKRKFPMAKNWLLYKQNNDGMYTVKDCLTDNEYTMGSTIAWFCRQLNGYRNPYQLGISRAEADELLQKLDEHQLLRSSFTTRDGPGSVMRTLWIPKRKRSHSWLCKFINTLLIVSFLPVFAIGAYRFFSVWLSFELDYLLFGSILGILVGAILHECAHAFAGYAFGGYIFEAGIAFTGFLPGAYVMIEHSHIKNRWKRLQIFAAGVEMNLLLAGTFMLLAPAVPSVAGMLFGAAYSNVFLMLLNCTLAQGMDGSAIIGQLLSCENWVAYAKYTILTKKERKRLMKHGLPGVIELAACYIANVSGVVFPVVFALNILEIISCVLG